VKFCCNSLCQAGLTHDLQSSICRTKEIVTESEPPTCWVYHTDRHFVSNLLIASKPHFRFEQLNQLIGLHNLILKHCSVA